MEIGIQKVGAIEVRAAQVSHSVIRQEHRCGLLLELSCLTDRVLRSGIRNILPVLLEHMGGWPEISFAAVAKLVVVEECGLGHRGKGVIGCRGRRGGLGCRHIGWSANGDDRWRCVVLNRHRCSRWRRWGWHGSSGSGIVRNAIELVGHPVRLVRQQGHARNHCHEVGHAEVHDRLLIVVKRGLQVCRHGDRLAWWWLREDLLRLIKYVVVTTAYQVSGCAELNHHIQLTVCKGDE